MVISIVVDTQNNDIRPLPNLDFNFMTGNSLLEEFEGVKLFDEKLLKKNLKETYTEAEKLNAPTLSFQKGLFGGIEDLKIDIMMKLDELHKKFFKERNNEVKKNIKRQIEDTEWILIQETLSHSGNSDKIKELEKLRKQKRKPYFLWKLEFARVFKEKGGFDIVIGNPPYVGEGKMKEIFIPIQKSSFGEKYYIGKMDFWYFFTSLGIELIKKDGILSYIAPNNWMTTAGGKKMRNHIMKEMEIKKYISFGDYMVFENASQQTMIFLLQKNQKETRFEAEISELKSKKGDIVKINDFLNNKESEAHNYYKAVISKDKFKEGDNIQFLNNQVDSIIDKIRNSTKNRFTSKEIAQGIVAPQDCLNKSNAEKLGLKQGSGIFVLNSEEKMKKQFQLNELQEIVKPYFTSNEIERYLTYKTNNQWILYTKSSIKENINNYPNIKKHLDEFEGIITSDNKPYGLHRARDEKFFNGEKIISLRKCPERPVFSYNNGECYVAQTFFVIKTDRMNLKYLTALLNSKLIVFWLKNMGKMQGTNYQIDKEPLLSIPIAESENEIENEMIELVEKIMELKKQSKESQQLETELDELVYEIYDLNSEEKEFIRNF